MSAQSNSSSVYSPGGRRIIFIDDDSSDNDEQQPERVQGLLQRVKTVTEKENKRINESNKLAADSSDDEETPTDALLYGGPVFHQKKKEEDDDLPPTMEQLQTTCWKCAATLKLPATETCLYNMHTHPVLNVPVCCVCAEEIAAVEESDDNYCRACARDEDTTLLLCDECNGAFCTRCVAQAHGGGRSGQALVEKLLQDDDDNSPWKCPACDPPPALESIRLHLQQDNEESTTTTRTVEDALQELDMAEQERQYCEEMLEQEDEKREEFRRELMTSLSGEELENQVEEALQVWKDDWLNHDKRLADFCMSLQDELETVHKIDLAKCYQKVLGQEKAVYDEDEEEPQWVREANRQARKQNADQPVVNPSDPSVYMLDLPTDDVEDLGTPQKDRSSLLAKGFRHCHVSPSKEQIESALKAEEEMLVQHNICIKRVIEEAQDAEETMQEERQVSVPGSKGVSRVRRDAYQFVRYHAKDKRHIASGVQVAVASHAERRERNEVARAPRESASDNGKPRASRLSKRGAASSRSSEDDTDTTSLRKRLSPSGSGECIFADSDLVLCQEGVDSAIRTVTVAKLLAEQLKSHQKEGIYFMWRNSFADFAQHLEGKAEEIGGCILAHNMGLGKSFSTIALLHAVMTHPAMRTSETGRPLLDSVLLVVPVNTLANWQNEFVRWIGHLSPTLVTVDLGNTVPWARKSEINRWKRHGGILLMSGNLLPRLVADNEIKKVLQPDVLVMDEAHTMLKNSNSQIFKALSTIETPRRIALTGSPFQNNLLEYYRMVNFVRPNVLDVSSEAEFEREYVAPIMDGMVSDASRLALRNSLLQSERLSTMLEPYIHRKDASELMKELPPMQQVVLHVRQSRMQCKLYRHYNRLKQQESEFKNFFKEYATLRPVHNHPGCLLLHGTDGGEGGSSGEQSDEGSSEWWKKALKPAEIRKLKNISNGLKVEILLHILAYAVKLGDKVLVFSLSLKTLDFIEEVLSLDDWASHIPSIESSFPGQKLGNWKKGKDFLRLDGAVKSTDRGDLVTQFSEEKAGENVRAFLISSQAGGIGINLPAANRVVLLDSHFNPTVTTQALFRSYRFGQKKHVYCYRLLTEGTIEEKVYARSVNKDGVAVRVIDKKTINRTFTARELADLQENDTWVQCDDCEKWRMLIGDTSEVNLEGEWFCDMNKNDNINNKCDASEKTKKWYDRHFFDSVGGAVESPVKCMAQESESTLLEASKMKLVEQDEILQHLLKIENGKSKKAAVISRYYFHEALLNAKATSKDELATVTEMMEMEASAAAASQLDTGTRTSTVSSGAKRSLDPSFSSPTADLTTERGATKDNPAEHTTKLTPVKSDGASKQIVSTSTSVELSSSALEQAAAVAPSIAPPVEKSPKEGLRTSVADRGLSVPQHEKRKAPLELNDQLTVRARKRQFARKSRVPSKKASASTPSKRSVGSPHSTRSSTGSPKQQRIDDAYGFHQKPAALKQLFADKSRSETPARKKQAPRESGNRRHISPRPLKKSSPRFHDETSNRPNSGPNGSVSSANARAQQEKKSSRISPVLDKAEDPPPSPDLLASSPDISHSPDLLASPSKHTHPRKRETDIAFAKQHRSEAAKSDVDFDSSDDDFLVPKQKSTASRKAAPAKAVASRRKSVPQRGGVFGMKQHRSEAAKSDVDIDSSDDDDDDDDDVPVPKRKRKATSLMAALTKTASLRRKSAPQLGVPFSSKKASTRKKFTPRRKLSKRRAAPKETEVIDLCSSDGDDSEEGVHRSCENIV